jgi:hypothetical protein
MTKWQKASTPKEAEAIANAWHQYGVENEVLTDDQIEHLKAGGYLCVYQGEYGLVLRYKNTPPPWRGAGSGTDEPKAVNED